jgi:hypothetical protein
MPYNKTYTEAELFLFRQKDKRIMWQSVFSSLCDLVQNNTSIPVVAGQDTVDALSERAKSVVAWLEKQYPTEEAGKTPEYKEKELEEAIAETEKRLAQLKNIKSGNPF